MTPRLIDEHIQEIEANLHGLELGNEDVRFELLRKRNQLRGGDPNRLDQDLLDEYLWEITPPAQRPFRMKREALIALCERAIVPMKEWGNRDSFRAQTGVATVWMLLNAGCEFQIHSDTDDWTIWITFVDVEGFASFEGGEPETKTYYIPTPERLERAAGRDWYRV